MLNTEESHNVLNKEEKGIIIRALLNSMVYQKTIRKVYQSGWLSVVVTDQQAICLQ